MTNELRIFLVAFVSGVLFAIGMDTLLGMDQEPTAAEAGRAYTAYRACIQRSGCIMTPQDWIEYYELKWEIEGEVSNE